MGIGSFLSGAAHAVGQFFDPDTSVPAGTNPADIYKWFHAGPGTKSYQSAADSLSSATQSMQGYTNYLTQAQQALSAGWTGSAADAAQQSFTPMNQAAQQIATATGGLHSGLTDQISTFNDTKGKVVNVPTTPPSGPGLGDYISMVTPLGVANVASADMSVSDYQNSAHANQQAYTGYQGPTNSQASGLPQGTTTPPPTPPPNQPVTPPPSAPPVHLGGGAPSAHGSYGSSRGSQYSGSYQGANGMNGNPGANPNMPQIGSNNPNNLNPGSTNVQGYTPPSGTSTPPGTNPYGGSSGGYSPTGGFGGAPGGGGSTSGGGFAGGLGGAGAGGGFGGSGGYGSSGAAGAGSRSGVGGMGAGEEEAGGFGSAAAGSKGASGSPGMGGGGRGGKGQGDTEHKTASYLQENDPNAIFGTDEKTVPPVIGG